MVSSFSLLRQNQETYDRCHEILGLPAEVEWSDIEITFGNDAIGQVVLTLLPTGEQVRELAALAIQQAQDSCAAVVAKITENCPPYDDDGIECPNCTVNDREDCMYPEGH